MSGRKIPEVLLNFFKDLNLMLELEEVYSKSDLYTLYCNSVDPVCAESTFGKYLGQASAEGIIRLEFSPEQKGWVSKVIDTSTEEDAISEMEDMDEIQEDIQYVNKGLMFDLIKNELAVAFRHVAENISPELIREMFKDQIQILVKQEFRKEVIPAVMTNLEKVIDSAKEELQEQIDSRMDSVTLKSYILEVIREAFEFPIATDMEVAQDQTEES